MRKFRKSWAAALCIALTAGLLTVAPGAASAVIGPPPVDGATDRRMCVVDLTATTPASYKRCFEDKGSFADPDNYVPILGVMKGLGSVAQPVVAELTAWQPTPGAVRPQYRPLSDAVFHDLNRLVKTTYQQKQVLGILFNPVNAGLIVVGKPADVCGSVTQWTDRPVKDLDQATDDTLRTKFDGNIYRVKGMNGCSVGMSGNLNLFDYPWLPPQPDLTKGGLPAVHTIRLTKTPDAADVVTQCTATDMVGCDLKVDGLVTSKYGERYYVGGGDNCTSTQMQMWFDWSKSRGWSYTHGMSLTMTAGLEVDTKIVKGKIETALQDHWSLTQDNSWTEGKRIIHNVAPKTRAELYIVPKYSVHSGAITSSLPNKTWASAPWTVESADMAIEWSTLSGKVFAAGDPRWVERPLTQAELAGEGCRTQY